MTTLPDNLTRFTGANTFTAQDFHGNIFYAFQGPDDTGYVTMAYPDGSSTTVLEMPNHSGRPALECNPLVGLWAVGNKETGSRATPPRYPIVQYVPFPAGTPGPQGAQGVPGPAGMGTMLFAQPLASPAWSGRTLNGGVLIDVPTVFGVAPEPLYLVRLSATAPAAGIITRTGTTQAPYFVTLVSQAANVRNDTQGWTPGPSIYISTVGGSATVWLQVVGVSV
jgi:hypothetical protein